MDCQLLAVLFHQDYHPSCGVQTKARQHRLDLVVALFAHQDWAISHRKNCLVGRFRVNLAVCSWKDFVARSGDKQLTTIPGFVGPHPAKPAGAPANHRTLTPTSHSNTVFPGASSVFHGSAMSELVQHLRNFGLQTL